ncbi:MAG TPA: peptidase M50, partial [Deltaproteobacteria bacterium]|nr:peptidase M50 [Deltaproteobacteria bacterium]
MSEQEQFYLNTEESTTQHAVRRRREFIIPIALFILTVATTIIAGALQKGVNPFQEPFRLIEGIPFSLTLLTILLTHEFGHFFASRRHGVKASFPYFIPAPPPFLVGTFGAVIKTRSPIMDKRALLDIGAIGPLAGFITSIVVTVIGLNFSTIITIPEEKEVLGLGSSLIFSILSYFVIGPVPEGQDILLHPIAFAGWIGFFITSLNLLPIGQLDGGHIIYAVFGKWHRLISITMIGILVIFGIFTWQGWLLWAMLVTLLGIKHPPLMDGQIALDRRRKIIGWLSLAVF